MGRPLSARARRIAAVRQTVKGRAERAPSKPRRGNGAKAKATTPLTMTEHEDLIDLALTDPDALLLADAKGRAEASFAAFVGLLWHEVIPDRRAWGWAFDAICDHLEAVTYGHIRRLLINVPPGFSKSALTNVFWPAWEWGPLNRPHLAHFATSHDLEMATEQNRLCRELITSPLYQRLWGDRVQLYKDQSAKKRFIIRGGGFRAVTALTSATGGRGHRMVADDIHSVMGAESEADRSAARRSFSKVLPSRLKVPDRDALVMIGQRLHPRDAYSLAIRLGYVHLALPMRWSLKHKYQWKGAALEPLTQYGGGDPRSTEGELLNTERYPARAEGELRDQLRIEGGLAAEAGQLDQNPTEEGGTIFPLEESRYQIVDYVPHVLGAIACRGWDFAATISLASKWSAGVKLWRVPFEGDEEQIQAGGVPRYRWFIEHVERFRGTPLTVRQKLRARAEHDGYDVVISIPKDPAAAGVVQLEDYGATLSGFNVHSSPETGSKADRAAPLAAQAELGNLYLVRGDWNAAFISEAQSFTGHESGISDQIDGATRAFSKLAPRAVRRTVGGAYTIEITT